MFKKILTAETIQYQYKDYFPPELNKYVTAIYDEIDNDVYTNNKELLTNSPNVKNMISCINERFKTNIQIEPIFTLLSPAAIIPAFGDYLNDYSNVQKLDISSIFKYFMNFNEYGKLVKKIEEVTKEREAIIKSINGKKGYIDLKNAKVGGYLSELKHYLIIDFYELKSEGMTTNELTAIILHEIGHAIDGMENHYKLEKFNLTILDIIKEINKNNIDRAEYIFKNDFATEQEFKEYITTDRTRSDMAKVNPQLFNSKYDETIQEAQADEFVSRFGYGMYLVSALNKIHHKYGQVAYNDSYKIIYFIQLLVELFIVAILNVAGVIYAAIMIAFILNANNVDQTYDYPTDRYNRIKNSIVNSLKNQKLPKDVAKDLLAQYNFIDKVMKECDYFKHIYTKLSEYITISGYQVKYYTNLQKEIENGLNNKLFVKSVELNLS